MIDWITLANEAHDAWRNDLAKAVGTTPDRVSVHVVHQHDAPAADYTTAEILTASGYPSLAFDDEFVVGALRRTAEAAADAVKQPVNVSHLGYGTGRVEKFASNRRVIGKDGKIKFWRGSSTANADARAEPEGVIDPDLRLLSFWNDETPVVSMTYYASHPQSYYGRGGVSADTVGLARAARETALPDVAHLHFNGAGGNVAPGKYNDGSTTNRPVLGARLAAGMEAAFDNVTKVAVSAADVRWDFRPVKIPVRKTLNDKKIRATLADPLTKPIDRVLAALELAWILRHQEGHAIDIGCLKIGPVRILHMPGELFVEYQLAAQQMRPDLFVGMAAYGDWAPGYIGTRAAYPEGGYEVGQVSRTGPDVEAVLTAAMRELLDVGVTPAIEQAVAPPFYDDQRNLMHYLDDTGKAQPVESLDDWQKRRDHILKNFEYVAGAVPSAARIVDGDVVVEKTESLPHFVRKKISYLSEAGDRVPAYLLIPHNITSPVPAVLCLHQTTVIGCKEPVGLGGRDDLHYAAELAERGYVTLAPDYPFLGENRFEPYENGYVSCIMKGIWNHMRAVDVLQKMPEVNPNRIGVIGHSLGGHNSLFLAAHDHRIRCVVSCCGYTTNEAYLKGNGIPAFATPNKRYFPRMVELTQGVSEKQLFDMTEIAAAIAPRPLLTVAPVGDGNFPVAGVKDCQRSLQPLYQLHDATDRLDYDFPEGAHGFPDASREKAYAWMGRWLKK